MMITEGGGMWAGLLQSPHHQQSRKQVWQNIRLLMRIRSRISAYISQKMDEWSLVWDKRSMMLILNVQKRI